jgi:hypothetical protein
MESASGVPPPISGAPTSIALFAGWAPSGPTDRAVHLEKFLDYEDVFGSIDPTSLLGHAVYHFYVGGNDGADAYALRIASASSAPVGPNDDAFLTSLRAAFAAGGPVDQIAQLNLICVPGLTEPTMIAMLQAYAHRRGAFLIVDCDEGATVTTIAASLRGKTGTDAPNSALYFPWVMASDLSPNSTATRAYPPCGFVAGLYARIDRERGVWKAPAGDGAVLTSALGLSVNIDDAESSALNPLGINCLRSFPNMGPMVWGARTLAAANDASEWKYVPVQRLAIFIEQSVVVGTQWAVFEPNNAALWTMLHRSIDAFMNSLYRQGAFQGTTPAQAYVVKCDATTTTQVDIDSGVVNIVIGFAPLTPTEFVVITIAQLAASGPRSPSPRIVRNVIE